MDFMGKMSFTIVSLATGFKGGEVTPLFYIGATLGNALAPLLHMPFAFMAGIGLWLCLPVRRIPRLRQPLWRWNCSVPKWRYFLPSAALRHIFFQDIPGFIMPSESVMPKAADTVHLFRQSYAFLKFLLFAGRNLSRYHVKKMK
jgi:hypothetical protein